jgi:hypothetical protein
MKTRVASAQATQQLRELGAFKKRNIACYVVQVDGQPITEFEFFKTACGYAAKMAKLGKTAKVCENAGAREYVLIETFEKDPSALISEVRSALAARHETATMNAVGKTSAARWQDASTNTKVPIMLRVKQVG